MGGARCLEDGCGLWVKYGLNCPYKRNERCFTEEEILGGGLVSAQSDLKMYLVK
jgi:hypothetical protein